MTPLARARAINRKLDKLIPRFRRQIAKEKNRYITAQVAYWGRAHTFSDDLDSQHENNMFAIFEDNYKRIFRVASDAALAAHPDLVKAREGQKKAPLFDTHFGEWLITNGARKVKTTAQTTAADLKKLMRDAFEAEEAENVVIRAGLRAKGLTAFRADTIARTEIGMAAAYAAKKTINALASEVGVRKMTKQWVPVNDDRTRDAHADMAGSAPIDNSEKFDVGGELMDGPHDPDASPENVINCRCALIYNFDL